MKTELDENNKDEYLKPSCSCCGITMAVQKNAEGRGKNGRPVLMVQFTCQHCLNTCVVVYYSRVRQDGYAQPSCLCFWANPETGKEQFAREDHLMEILEKDRIYQKKKEALKSLQD